MIYILNGKEDGGLVMACDGFHEDLCSFRWLRNGRGVFICTFIMYDSILDDDEVADSRFSIHNYFATHFSFPYQIEVTL